ncbi:hypothetical protein CPB84DRAFT_1760336, partial [Gymnopilus junonius]
MTSCRVSITQRRSPVRMYTGQISASLISSPCTMPLRNVPVPGAYQYFPLNEPAIGTPLDPQVRLCMSMYTDLL